jgi:hypothetical protein
VVGDPTAGKADVAEVRRALSTSRAKRLAVDQLDPPNSLGSLLRERDLLWLTMSQAGPDPSRAIAAATGRIEETKARLAKEHEQGGRARASPIGVAPPAQHHRSRS